MNYAKFEDGKDETKPLTVKGPHITKVLNELEARLGFVVQTSEAKELGVVGGNAMKNLTMPSIWTFVLKNKA